MLCLSPEGVSLFHLPSGYRAVASFRASNVSCSRTLQQTGCPRPSHAVSLATRWEKKREDKHSNQPVTGSRWPWMTRSGAICCWKPVGGDIRGLMECDLNRMTKQFTRNIWPFQCDPHTSGGGFNTGPVSAVFSQSLTNIEMECFQGWSLVTAPRRHIKTSRETDTVLKNSQC